MKRTALPAEESELFTHTYSSIHSTLFRLLIFLSPRPRGTRAVSKAGVVLVRVTGAFGVVPCCSQSSEPRGRHLLPWEDAEVGIPMSMKSETHWYRVLILEPCSLGSNPSFHLFPALWQVFSSLLSPYLNWE